MEFIFEFIAELVFEVFFEIGTNKKVNKWIRYPFLILIILFFSLVIFSILYLGIKLFDEERIVAIILIGLALFFLIGSILKFIKVLNSIKKD